MASSTSKSGVDSPVVKKKNAPRTILDGIDYYLKYLGKAQTDKIHGPGSTEEAVEIIRQQAKGSKVMHKVKLTVSTKYIRVYDFQTEILLFETPLYRVSYCTVDNSNNKICCYIVRESGSKELYVHAFYCSKKSKAEALTLTVAEAFNIAYAEWQAKKILAAADDKTKAVFKSTEPQPTELETNNSTILPINEVDSGMTGIAEIPEITETPEIENNTVPEKDAEPANASETRIESFDGEIPMHHPVSMAPLGHDDVFGEMNIEDFSDEVQAFLRGEVSAEDLVRARSVDDLLDL
ncbi:Low density lipoprotein receptor adapter protein 1-A-like [Oopsacas minuta]|uniref:Low density lipoprotein receptor adapter protein 1-A-like n=1 Tax=Oopsacas minuta TaxID=111878 RepID=A0AAV7JLT2_9METZ|nr:Low density lipoprotein receptor adapter protein 1-A-like [Oopsacas minuta]